MLSAPPAPPGAGPGTTLQIQNPQTGQILQVQVPPGVQPGMQFRVRTGGVAPAQQPQFNLQALQQQARLPRPDHKLPVPHIVGIALGHEAKPALQALDPATRVIEFESLGTKVRVVIPPELAYGERGLTPKVPPNTTLLVEIELLSFESGDYDD